METDIVVVLQGWKQKLQGCHGTKKIMQDQAEKNAFYCNAAISSPPVAKRESVTTSFESQLSHSPDNEISSISFDIQELSVIHIH